MLRTYSVTNSSCLVSPLFLPPLPTLPHDHWPGQIRGSPSTSLASRPPSRGRPAWPWTRRPRSPPPSHHRVCKPEAACYAKITEKLCLRNINAVGDLDSTLLPEVVLMLRDCGLWKAPMNSSARSSPPRISSCGSRTLPPQQCSCSAWRQHDGLVRLPAPTLI